MATMDTGMEGGRDGLPPERVFRGYLVAAAAGLVVALTYYMLSNTVEMVVGDPNEGKYYLEPLLVAFVVAPLVLMPGALLPLLRAGSRRLAALRSGEDQARRSVRGLSYGFAGAWAFTTGVITYFFINSENGFGLSLSTRFNSELLNAGGWLGAVAVVLSAALAVSALAVAVFTRPVRD
jgi:hypothetical protein